MDGAMRQQPPAGPGRFRGDAGASVVEYAILIGLVAVVCIVAVNYLGDATAKSLSTTANGLETTGAPAATVVVTTAPPTTVDHHDED